MSLRAVAIAIAFLMLALAGYGLWKRSEAPPRIVSTGVVDVASPQDQVRKRLLTRVVEAGGITLNEIELPNGTWIDCSGDCASAARKATVDFWDEKQKSKK